MNLHLETKSALVTGGAAGIGESIVRLLAAEGVGVTIADRDTKRGEALAKELSANGVKVRFVAVDLTTEADCRNAVEETLRAFGGLDILVNNAGVNDSVSLDHTPEDFMASLQRNLFPVFAITHHAREALKKSTQWIEARTLPPQGDALYEHMMKLPVAAQVVTEKTSAAGAPVKSLGKRKPVLRRFVKP